MADAFREPAPVDGDSSLPARFEAPPKRALVSPANRALDLPAPAYGAPPSPAQQQTVSVTNVIAAPAVSLQLQRRGPSLLVRALWFVCVGWWLSGLMILLGYALMAPILTIPLGIWFLHRVPQAQTLRDRTREFQTQTVNGQLVLAESTVAQRALPLRALWFVFVGWWLSALWLTAAWSISLLIVTLPLSIWMIDRTPAVLTLQRH